MTEQEFKALLDSTNIPFAYRLWDKENLPPLPYGVYFIPDTDNFKADGKTCIENKTVIIELYSSKKDLALEKKLKTALDNAEIFYQQTSETFITSEKMLQTVYEVEI